MIGTDRHREILRIAEDLYRASPPWATFFREIFGRSGIVRRRLPTPRRRADFEQSAAYAEIQQMLRKLREREVAPSDQGPTRVITIRLPASMHAALRDEAHAYETSMNKLCISKLLQIIDDSLVPAEKYKNNEAGVDL